MYRSDLVSGEGLFYKVGVVECVIQSFSVATCSILLLNIACLIRGLRSFHNKPGAGPSKDIQEGESVTAVSIKGCGYRVTEKHILDGFSYWGEVFYNLKEIRFDDPNGSKGMNRTLDSTHNINHLGPQPKITMVADRELTIYVIA